MARTVDVPTDNAGPERQEVSPVPRSPDAWAAEQERATAHYLLFLRPADGHHACMGEIAERYRRRAEAFERKVAAVRAEQWGNRSPCAEWTARDVVEHVVTMHGVMLAPVARKLEPADDPLIAFQEARAAIEDVLDDPVSALTETDTPAGRVTTERHIDEVLSDDLVLHGWDLARATGQDELMDPLDVERLWATAVAIPPDLMAKYRTPGASGIEVYGPEVPVAADAPLQDRLLGLLGREP